MSDACAISNIIPFKNFIPLSRATYPVPTAESRCTAKPFPLPLQPLSTISFQVHDPCCYSLFVTLLSISATCLSSNVEGLSLDNTDSDIFLHFFFIIYLSHNLPMKNKTPPMPITPRPIAVGSTRWSMIERSITGKIAKPTPTSNNAINLPLLNKKNAGIADNKNKLLTHVIGERDPLPLAAVRRSSPLGNNPPAGCVGTLGPVCPEESSDHVPAVQPAKRIEERISSMRVIFMR